MILRMAPRGGDRATPATLTAVSLRVLAIPRDQGRVVVQLRAVNLKLADRDQHQLRQKRHAIAVKQLIQSPADTII